MQLLMRRLETDGFISVSPPTNMYDFAFLAPCPASGLILHGSADTVVPNTEVPNTEVETRVGGKAGGWFPKSASMGGALTRRGAQLHHVAPDRRNHEPNKYQV